VGYPLRKEETVELSLVNRKILIFDFEVFKYDWLVVVKDHETKEKTVIINDVQRLRTLYDENHQNIFVGYNSREYDQYILKGILLGIDPWFINTEIITNGKRGWQVVKDNDEYPLYNFDISTGFHSLKQLEGFMGSMIKESDIPFDIDRKLTPEEIEQTVYYCTHDVDETEKVFEYRREEFDSQLLMIEAFDLPMTMFNKTKAQLSAAILEAQRGKDRNDEFELIFPNTIQIGEKYQPIVNWYKDKKNHDYEKSLITEVAGIPHVFAWGGLHAAIPNYQAEGKIVHCDVASLYPSIMIEYDFLSRNVKDRTKYPRMKEDRMRLKRLKDPRQKPLKIVINATFGAQKDERNPLYDPLQANNVCVGGQLLILDLIEKIEDHCFLIQSNTDGLFLLVDSDEQLEKVKAIAKEWEERTRLELEWEVSKKIVQKDVNNYLVVEEDGSYESKGAYLKKLSDIDYDLPIVNKSLIDYFIHGTPIRQTIESCNDLRDFQKIIKITSLYKYALLGDKKIKEKVHRVFASKDPNAPGLHKVKSEGSTPEKVSYTPDHCFIFNDYCKGLPCPDELDKEYYVQMAEKRLDDFLSTKKTKTSKIKSGIKFINYETKAAIDAVNQEEYEAFIDLVLFILQEKILGKREIGILIKLDYFKTFGNSKELLRLFEMMAFFKYGACKSIKKDKFEEYEYLRQIVEKHASDKTKSGKESAAYLIEDMEGIFRDCEKMVMAANLTDFRWKEKVKFQYEFTGGVYPTYEDTDRKTLLISEIRPVSRRKDNKQFGYNVSTISLGSGVEGKFTIMNSSYRKCPVEAGDVIRCIDFKREGSYFTMLEYRKAD
jgi:hypothetical protein